MKLATLVIHGESFPALPRARAFDYVFGYVIINDVTARDPRARHKQGFVGRSPDTFCPMGPWLATADEMGDAGLEPKCWVYGELRQEANTCDLIFDVATPIETLSSGLTRLGRLVTRVE